MPSVTAYTTENLKEKLDRAIGEEGRNQAQVGSSAFALYTALPLPARRALHDLLTHEERTGEAVLEGVMKEISRALLRASWRLTDERVVSEVRAHGRFSAGELEAEEISALAVELADRVEDRRLAQAG